MLQRVWIVVLGLAMLFAAANIWTRESMTRPAVVVPHQVTQTTTVIDNNVPTFTPRVDDWAEPELDLNGNEVDAAVGDYRIDGRGEMYERHAPDTALLHLSAPKL